MQSDAEKRRQWQQLQEDLQQLRQSQWKLQDVSQYPPPFPLVGGGSGGAGSGGGGFGSFGRSTTGGLNPNSSIPNLQNPFLSVSSILSSSEAEANHSAIRPQPARYPLFSSQSTSSIQPDATLQALLNRSGSGTGGSGMAGLFTAEQLENLHQLNAHSFGRMSPQQPPPQPPSASSSSSSMPWNPTSSYSKGLLSLLSQHQQASETSTPDTTTSTTRSIPSPLSTRYPDPLYRSASSSTSSGSSSSGGGYKYDIPLPPPRFPSEKNSLPQEGLRRATLFPTDLQRLPSPDSLLSGVPLWKFLGWKTPAPPQRLPPVPSSWLNEENFKYLPTWSDLDANQLLSILIHLLKSYNQQILVNFQALYVQPNLHTSAIIPDSPTSQDLTDEALYRYSVEIADLRRRVLRLQEQSELCVQIAKTINPLLLMIREAIVAKPDILLDPKFAHFMTQLKPVFTEQISASFDCFMSIPNTLPNLVSSSNTTQKKRAASPVRSASSASMRNLLNPQEESIAKRKEASSFPESLSKSQDRVEQMTKQHERSDSPPAVMTSSSAPSILASIYASSTATATLPAATPSSSSSSSSSSAASSASSPIKPLYRPSRYHPYKVRKTAAVPDLPPSTPSPPSGSPPSSQ